MKKFLVLLISLIIISGFSVCAFASETAEISLSYTSEDGKIIVEVDLSENGEPCMIQFCVAYDSGLLECVSAVSGDAFSGISAPLINSTEGKIIFVWDALSPLENGGTVMKMEFLPKENNKTASVWIDQTEDFIIANENFEEIGSVKGNVEFNTGGSSSENTSSEKTESSGNENIPGENKTSGENSSEEQTSESEEKSQNPDSSASSSVTESEQKNENDIPEESAPENSVSEKQENVLNVESPRTEKEEKTPVLVWVLIIVLAAAAAALVFILVKKIKAKEEGK